MDKGHGIVDSDEPMSFERLCEAEPALDLFAHVSPLVEKVYNEGRQFGVRQERVASRDRLTGLNVVNAVYLLKVIAADLGLEYADRSHEEHFEAIRRRLTQLNAADKMAAAEWAARETDLKEVIEAGNNACREIAEQRDAEERSRIWISDRHNAAVLRCAALEQALAATGVYLAGLKIYDEDPTARRIVERNLELLRNGVGGQEPGAGEERATCGKCGATVIEAPAGVTVGDREQGIGDSEEEDSPASVAHDFEAKDGAMYCRRCDDPGAQSCVGAVISSRLGEPVYCEAGMCDHRYCTNLKPEPRTVFESHRNKELYGENPKNRRARERWVNTAAMNGESYNAVAARLREEIPISDPIWQESNGKSMPGAIHPDTAVRHVSRTIPLVDNLNHLRHRLQNAVEWFAHLREQNTLLFTSTEQADSFRVDLGGMMQALKTIKAINPVDFPPPNMKQSKDDETATARLERLREAYLMVRRAEGGQWAAYPGAHEVFRKALVEVFGAIPAEGGTTNANPV